MIKLRPHHVLCIGHYKGKGYSKEFTENADLLISRLKSGERVLIVSGEDDLCRACPNNINGACADKEKVKRYDEKTAELLNLVRGEGYNCEELSFMAKTFVYDPEKFDTVCPDCEWSDICRGK